MSFVPLIRHGFSIFFITSLEGFLLLMFSRLEVRQEARKVEKKTWSLTKTLDHHVG